MLIRNRIPGLLNALYETKTALIQNGVWVPKRRNILAVLRTPSGKLAHLGSNLITDAGEIYYAQRSVGASPTNAFGIHELASAGTPGAAANRSAFTVIGSTQKAHAATYPLVNDADADNTGAGVNVVTYLASYTQGDFNASGISHGIITNATPGASEPILTGYAFAAPFNKTADDTLRIYVNHTVSGV